jgi:hypothetical protein
MKPTYVASIAIVAMLCGCKPKAPEQPTRPPTPTTIAQSPASDRGEQPTFASRIQTGGRTVDYRAYFDNGRLSRIRESAADRDGIQTEYDFRGARLLKYEQVSSGAAPLTLELDDQGRVQHAAAGSRTLAEAEIATIRSRAQLLRSHALAQHASRTHAH